MPSMSLSPRIPQTAMVRPLRGRAASCAASVVAAAGLWATSRIHSRPLAGDDLKASRQTHGPQPTLDRVARHRQSIGESIRARTAPPRRCRTGSRPPARAAADRRARVPAAPRPALAVPRPVEVPPESSAGPRRARCAASAIDAGMSREPKIAGRPARKIPAFSRPMVSTSRPSQSQ